MGPSITSIKQLEISKVKIPSKNEKKFDLIASAISNSSNNIKIGPEYNNSDSFLERDINTDLNNSELALNSILNSELNFASNLDQNLRSLNKLNQEHTATHKAE